MWWIRKTFDALVKRRLYEVGLRFQKHRIYADLVILGSEVFVD
jgi:hypothetical protein